MTTADFLNILSKCRLIASVQASEGSAVDRPEALALLAQTSADQGVQILRLQGVENIRVVRQQTDLPAIGLIKRNYQDSPVYISSTKLEIDEVASTGAEIVAVDATSRQRPNNVSLKEVIDYAHQKGLLVLADIDTVENAINAEKLGCDLISTTLGGYTAERPMSEGPDLDLLREVVAAATVPVLAEGRISEKWQVEAALRIGASGVIVGGALNDPLKQTKALMPNPITEGKVGAVDIGGTWLRFATFTEDWKLESVERIGNPVDMGERLAWIREKVLASGVEKVGVSTGGGVDPRVGEVGKAKEYLMPNHVGIRFSENTLGKPTFAHGDGHATAWAHACLPQFAGKRVATLALGTGVGCGFVQKGHIWSGRRGEYPRVNDLPAPGGKSYEDLLGGKNLTSSPSDEAIQNAVTALQGAIQALTDLYFPDDIVIAGSVGLCDWLAPEVDRLGLKRSPFGTDAGLYGAAALALFPPPMPS